jgi:hypothetical protein
MQSMANRRKDERADGTEVKKLNWVGLGLAAIGERLGCHEATVSVKLKALGEKINDTRRSFMETVFTKLTREQQDWLCDYLYSKQIPIQDFIAQLIQQAYEVAPKEELPKPPELPKMPKLEEDDSDPFSIDTSSTVMEEIMKNLSITGTGVAKVTEEVITPIPTDSLFGE